MRAPLRRGHCPLRRDHPLPPGQIRPHPRIDKPGPHQQIADRRHLTRVGFEHDRSPRRHPPWRRSDDRADVVEAIRAMHRGDLDVFVTNASSGHTELWINGGGMPLLVESASLAGASIANETSFQHLL